MQQTEVARQPAEILGVRRRRSWRTHPVNNAQVREGANGIITKCETPFSPQIAAVTKVMSEFLALRNHRWQCSRDDPLRTGGLARFAHDLAELADSGEDRFVSLLSREAADELSLQSGMLTAAAVKAASVSGEIPKTS